MLIEKVTVEKGLGGGKEPSLPVEGTLNEAYFEVFYFLKYL